MAGREFQPELIGVLENLANRGYTDGFYQRHHTHEHQNIIVESMEDIYGHEIQEAAGGGYGVKIPLPAGSSYGLLSRYF